MGTLFSLLVGFDARRRYLNQVLCSLESERQPRSHYPSNALPHETDPSRDLDVLTFRRLAYNVQVCRFCSHFGLATDNPRTRIPYIGSQHAIAGFATEYSTYLAVVRLTTAEGGEQILQMLRGQGRALGQCT